MMTLLHPAPVYSKAGQAPWDTIGFELSAMLTSFTYTGLAAGTAYRFRVDAITAKGQGSVSTASEMLSTTTSTPGAPGQPLGSNQARFRWILSSIDTLLTLTVSDCGTDSGSALSCLRGDLTCSLTLSLTPSWALALTLRLTLNLMSPGYTVTVTVALTLTLTLTLGCDLGRAAVEPPRYHWGAANYRPSVRVGRGWG